MPDSVNVIRGKAFYAKVLGNPVDNYSNDGKEWTIEVNPDGAGMATLEKLGLGDRVSKGEKKDRILFRQREQLQNGDFNDPIRVVDANNQPWDQKKLIGNGSVVDVKFKVRDYGKGKKLGVYPQAVRVLEYVEYIRQEFAPLSEEDEFFRTPDNDESLKPSSPDPTTLDDDTDDEIPF